LVGDFARLIDEAKPDFVTMENVPQLRDHPVFEEFLASVSDYHVWSGIVECALYGVPQTRKRLVLLASRRGPISLAEPTLIDERAAPTVRDAIAHLPSLAAGESDAKDKMHSACRLSPLNLKRIRASKPGGTWRDWKASLVSACHRKSSGETYPSVYGRMEWNSLSPTITTQCFGYGNGRFGHPDQDRAITLREAAILQTFPVSYKFLRKGEKPKFSTMGRLIGNAVPVRLGEVVAESLLQHLKSPPASGNRKRRPSRPLT
jgi:DNA (cytosine-5)-methyltransferase 1